MPIELVIKMKMKDFVKSVNKLLETGKEIIKGNLVASCRVTVLLSFQEKTDDVCACT